MASLGTITFACEEPRALAEFWATVLDYDLEEPPSDLIKAIEAEGGDLNAAARAVQRVMAHGCSSRRFRDRHPTTFRSISI